MLYYFTSLVFWFCNDFFIIYSMMIDISFWHDILFILMLLLQLQIYLIHYSYDFSSSLILINSILGMSKPVCYILSESGSCCGVQAGLSFPLNILLFSFPSSSIYWEDWTIALIWKLYWGVWFTQYSLWPIFLGFFPTIL